MNINWLLLMGEIKTTTPFLNVLFAKGWVLNLLMGSVTKSNPLLGCSRSNKYPPQREGYFKKNTGKTFTKFVNEYRVNHAAKLLIESDLDIQSVCYEDGLNNFSNFSRFFKLHRKQTPKNFRNSMIKSLWNKPTRL